MFILIDNYDSFTWNLVQAIGDLDPSIRVMVVRNDQIDVEEAESMAPSRIWAQLQSMMTLEMDTLVSGVG